MIFESRFANQKAFITEEAMNNEVDKMAQPIAITQPLSSTTPNGTTHGWDSQGGNNGGYLWAQ